jgi:hypothetical protein
MNNLDSRRQLLNPDDGKISGFAGYISSYSGNSEDLEIILSVAFDVFPGMFTPGDKAYEIAGSFVYADPGLAFQVKDDNMAKNLINTYEGGAFLKEMNNASHRDRFVELLVTHVGNGAGKIDSAFSNLIQKLSNEDATNLESVLLPSASGDGEKKSAINAFIKAVEEKRNEKNIEIERKKQLENRSELEKLSDNIQSELTDEDRCKYIQDNFEKILDEFAKNPNTKIDNWVIGLGLKDKGMVMDMLKDISLNNKDACCKQRGVCRNLFAAFFENQKIQLDEFYNHQIGKCNGKETKQCKYAMVFDESEGEKSTNFFGSLSGFQFLHYMSDAKNRSAFMEYFKSAYDQQSKKVSPESGLAPLFLKIKDNKTALTKYKNNYTNSVFKDDISDKSFEVFLDTVYNEVKLP